jgi:hypothetical protein
MTSGELSVGNKALGSVTGGQLFERLLYSVKKLVFMELGC